jgi:hypothetical protein
VPTCGETGLAIATEGGGRGGGTEPEYGRRSAMRASELLNSNRDENMTAVMVVWKWR